MPRRVRKSSGSANVESAINGAKEVAAELSGNTKDATKFGMKEKATRGDSRPPRESRPTSSSVDRGGKRQPFQHLQLGGTFVSPEVVKRPLYSGRIETTDFLFERDFTSRPAVYVYPLWDVNWTFQSGVTTVDAQATTLSTYVTNMFNDILRTLQAQRLVNVSNVALANLTPAPVFNVAYVPTSMQALLRLYCLGASTVRMLESLLIAGDFNFAMSRIADAVMNNLQQLEAVSRKLRGFRVPPLLIDLIDKAVGVKVLDNDSPAMVYGNPLTSIGLQLDLTVPANIAAIITLADNFLTQCVNPGFNGGSGANLANDFQLIWSLFGNAYGMSGVWPTAIVSHDPGEYFQGFTSAIQWDHTGAPGHWFGVPNTSVVDMVPTLLPKGINDDLAKYYLSLLGYQKYTPEAPGVVTDVVAPNFVGLFAMNNGATPMVAASATSMVFYSQNATFTNSPQQGGAARQLNWQNSETSAWYWASPADDEVLTAAMYTSDQRYTNQLDLIKTRRIDMIDATQARLESIFVTSVL